MDQARLVRVVSNVGQDFIDRVHPLLHDFHVESEESLAVMGQRLFLWLERDIIFIPLMDRPGIP
jgi:hypothetical protein